MRNRKKKKIQKSNLKYKIDRKSIEKIKQKFVSRRILILFFFYFCLTRFLLSKTTSEQFTSASSAKKKVEQNKCARIGRGVREVDVVRFVQLRDERDAVLGDAKAFVAFLDDRLR